MPDFKSTLTLEACLERLKLFYPQCNDVTLKYDHRLYGAFYSETRTIFLSKLAKTTPFWLAVLMHEFRHSQQRINNVKYNRNKFYYKKIERDADKWAFRNINRYFYDIISEWTPFEFDDGLNYYKSIRQKNNEPFDVIKWDYFSPVIGK